MCGYDLPYNTSLDDIIEKEEDKKAILISIPVWVIAKLDKQAKKMGVSRSSLIKTYLYERVNSENEGE